MLKAMVIGSILIAGMLLTAMNYLGFNQSAGVPLLETSAWRGTEQAYGEGLLLRQDSKQGDVLLIKHSQHDTVYKYDPRGRSLSVAAREEWRQADGLIANCVEQNYPPLDLLRIDETTNTLLAGSRSVATKGATALKLTAAPSGKWAAVLSATGRKADSILPFIGGSGATGHYYHQVLSLPDAVPFKQAVQVPKQRANDSLIACWSANEQYVVYFQVSFNYLSVIPTECPQPQSQP